MEKIFKSIIKLINSCKKCRKYRDEYYIDWTVKFEVDDHYYLFALLPTINVQPFQFRYTECRIIDIWWLHLHICIGQHKRKEKTYGKN